MSDKPPNQKGFWSEVLKLAKPKYDYQRLVDRKFVVDPPWVPDNDNSKISKSPIHIVSDIDKTYLETEFETVRKLLKTALEKEHKKYSVAGAPLFFRGIRSDSKASIEDDSDPSRGSGVDSIHFVSSSPPQMRSVLRSKFSMDGLEWESDTFKNQVYNIVRGRPGELKQHVAYKTTAILELCRELPDHSELIFIGDNAEADPYIFAGLTLLIHGDIDLDLYKRFLLNGVVRTQSAVEICRSDFSWLRKKKMRVGHIWIRRVKQLNQEQSLQIENFRRWNLPFYYFPNFLDLSLLALRLGIFSYPKGLGSFLRRLINEYGYGRESVLGCLKVHLTNAAYLRVSEQSILWENVTERDLRPIEGRLVAATPPLIERKHLDEIHTFCFGSGKSD